MTPSLSGLKVTPSFCFAFKIPDYVTATNVHILFQVGGFSARLCLAHDKFRLTQKMYDSDLKMNLFIDLTLSLFLCTINAIFGGSYFLPKFHPNTYHGNWERKCTMYLDSMKPWFDKFLVLKNFKKSVTKSFHKDTSFYFSHKCFQM